MPTCIFFELRWRRPATTAAITRASSAITVRLMTMVLVLALSVSLSPLPSSLWEGEGGGDAREGEGETEGDTVEGGEAAMTIVEVATMSVGTDSAEMPSREEAAAPAAVGRAAESEASIAVAEVEAGTAMVAVMSTLAAR